MRSFDFTPNGHIYIYIYICYIRSNIYQYVANIHIRVPIYIRSKTQHKAKQSHGHILWRYCTVAVMQLQFDLKPIWKFYIKPIWIAIFQYGQILVKRTKIATIVIRNGVLTAMVAANHCNDKAILIHYFPVRHSFCTALHYGLLLIYDSCTTPINTCTVYGEDRRRLPQTKWVFCNQSMISQQLKSRCAAPWLT